MATVRLDFELDSEIYPELHAALVGLKTARARGERMRQLATAGLVWENVRIHGAAAIGPTPVDSTTASPAEPARPLPPTLDDFIDLAIDAAPEPEPEPDPTPAPEPRVVERLVARPLPVLMDVVPDVVPEPEVAHAVPDAHDTDDPPPHADDNLHLVSLAQKPASRSRLMRMKDKGLFKNG